MMRADDIYNRLKFTVLGSMTGWVELITYDKKQYIQVEMTMNQIIRLGYDFRYAIDKVRECEYHSDEQRRLKSFIPTWMPSGIFEYKNVSDNGIVTKSNILAIDIDLKDNRHITDFNIIKEKIFKLPYVFMIMNSISGVGFYVLILVKDMDKMNCYFKSLEMMFRQEYDIKIDSCYNIGRKRVLSYDDDIMLKPIDTDIKEYSVEYKEPKAVDKVDIGLIDYRQPVRMYNGNDIDEENEFRLKVETMIELGYDTGEHWKGWGSLGRAFKPFINGKELFRMLSERMSGYNAADFDKYWDRISSTHITDKTHGVKYITTVLNKTYGEGWKRVYKRLKSMK